MNVRLKLWVGGLASIILCACAGAGVDVHKEGLNHESIIQAGIKKGRLVDEVTYVSGQPSPEQLQVAAAAGIKHVINLRPKAELKWDEAEAVAALGMQYHFIPVAGAADVNTSNAARLQLAIQGLRGEPVLLHCASGNRVGALVALQAGLDQPGEVEAAIAKGRRWGLTRLEAVVRQQLMALD